MVYFHFFLPSGVITVCIYIYVYIFIYHRSHRHEGNNRNNLHTSPRCSQGTGGPKDAPSPWCDPEIRKIHFSYFPKAKLSSWWLFNPFEKHARQNGFIFPKYPKLMFPKIGVPPNHPKLVYGVINHPFWGTTIFGNTQIGVNMFFF